MLRIRVIPCLLLKGQGLVKTVKFKNPQYVGDPINAIKIFNDKEVDELMLLDITASVEGRGPSFETIKDVASECFMPLAYGGGIRSMRDIHTILSMGVEKVVVNTAAITKPDLIAEAVREFGSQAVVISMDVKKKLFGGYEIMQARGTRGTGYDPVTFAKKMSQLGAGELLLNAIERDGTQSGYDLELVNLVAPQVTIPVIAVGGAGRVDDFVSVCKVGGASAVAAGSMFVYTGKHRAVLITFPARTELEKALA